MLSWLLTVDTIISVDAPLQEGITAKQNTKPDVASKERKRN